MREAHEHENGGGSRASTHMAVGAAHNDEDQHLTEDDFGRWKVSSHHEDGDTAVHAHEQLGKREREQRHDKGEALVILRRRDAPLLAVRDEDGDAAEAGDEG